MLNDRVAEFISQNNLFLKDDAVGVAVSGGADSVCLLVCLKEAGYRNLTALHVEHGIRGEASEQDMLFTVRLCESLNIPCRVKRVLVKKERLSGETEESAARRLRYEFFFEMTKELSLKCIAVAHHIEDVSETLIHNLLRGSGARGLCSMKVKREPNIVRPLLFAKRSEIEEYLINNGYSWKEDATNENTDYTRNYLRKTVLPAFIRINPNYDEALYRTSKIIEEEDDALNDIAKKSFKAVSSVNPGIIELNIKKLKELHPAIIKRVIRIALGELLTLKDVEYSHIEAIYALIEDGRTGRSYELKGRFFIETSYNSLKLKSKNYIIKEYEEKKLNVPGKTELSYGTAVCAFVKEAKRSSSKSLEQYIKRELLEGAVIRTRKPGDVFSPFGSGEKKLKDWFIDKKIPRDKRDALPLLAAGNTVLWVIGEAISEKLRLTGEENRLVKIEFIK